MADTDRNPEGGIIFDAGGTDDTTKSKPNGAGPGNSGVEGTTFSFADSFTGSGSKASNEDSGVEGRTYAEAPVTKKRRGRTPYPRDEDGNIIRPAGASGTSVNKGNKAGLDKVVHNDREAMKAQVGGLFQFAAQLTKMPHWLLSEEEATNEANALCKLADSLKWDLSFSESPLACAVALALTTFIIVKPRMDETVRIANAINITPPSTSGEARTYNARPGTMDFSGDIDATVNKGETLQ